MSQENVERVRRGYEVINRAGLASEEAYRILAELLHPDVEWRDQRELPGATVHRGSDATPGGRAGISRLRAYGSAGDPRGRTVGGGGLPRACRWSSERCTGRA